MQTQRGVIGRSVPNTVNSPELGSEVEYSKTEFAWELRTIPPW